MKKVCGLVIAVLMVFLVLASGCVEKTQEAGTSTPVEAADEEEETGTKSSCDDDNICTVDTFNELTKQCEHDMKDECCGNEICEPDERCDEDEHQTACVDDCGRTCPAFLIVSKEAGATESDVFAISCGDNDCQQTGDNTFAISDDAKLKATITNLGEQTSDKLLSTFICGSGSKQAIADGKQIYGVVFEDYFNDNQDELNYINPIQSTTSNSATYYLELDTDNQEQPFTANCKVYIRTIGGFENEQNFILTFS